MEYVRTSMHARTHAINAGERDAAPLYHINRLIISSTLPVAGTPGDLPKGGVGYAPTTPGVIGFRLPNCGS